MSPVESSDQPPWGLSTIAVTAGRPVGPGAPFNVPPTFASTYRDGGEVGYGRWGNPTWSAFETALGALEGGQALAFASGMAAIAAVLETPPGGRGRDAARATRTPGPGASWPTLAQRGRLVPLLVDMTDTDAVLARIAGRGPALGRVADQPAARRGRPAARSSRRAHAAASRRSWTTRWPRPSCSSRSSPRRHRGGAQRHQVHRRALRPAARRGRHADEDLLARLLERRTLHGAIPGTLETWLALRGLRTLPLRIERAQASAQILAERLEQAPAVVRVRYPGLPSHPGHALALSQMRGPGAVLSFELADGAAAEALTSRLTPGGGRHQLRRRRDHHRPTQPLGR